ncbi:MAG: hypothetical protein HRT72_07610 [Flavobacteriales bacterium]|nr:hypothetical protein [Flavobacteriales bacterium]
MKKSILLSFLCAAITLSGFAQTAPSNDLCANAITVSLGTYNSTNENATGDDSPTECGFSKQGVWLSYTATANEEIELNLCNTVSDMVIEVYSGTCGALTCVEA